jgi:predicted dithiol-disulfide oxidoreductase (DUF899 family)
MDVTAQPPIVSAEEWERARAELLGAEKEATRAQDALAARRRRLPMMQMGAYVFATPSGPKTLVDLFGDLNQLIVYQFMDNGPDHFCPGCTHFTNNWRRSRPTRRRRVGPSPSSHRTAPPSPTTAAPAVASC